MTLKMKMILYFSIGFSSVLIIFGSLVLSYNIGNFQKQSYEYARKIVKSNIILIDQYFEQLEKISRIVANDKEIIRAVSYRNQTEKVDYSVELYHQRDVADKINQLDVLSSISNALIIGNRFDCLYYYGTSPVQHYSFRDKEWISKNSSNNNKVRFTNYHPTDYLLNPREDKTVSIITPIRDLQQYGNKQNSFLICDFNLAPILSDSSDKSDTQIAIYDGTDPVYIPSNSSLSSAQMEQLDKNLKDGNHSFIIKKQNSSDKSYLIVNETSKISGWSILGIKALTEIDAMRLTITSFTFILIIVSCAMTVLLSILIFKSIFNPINQLVSNFNQISKGNLNVRFEETKSIEINTLSRTADNMVKSIINLTNDVAQEQLKALQHQINPHFLNNVLQSMKSLAVSGCVEDISKMTTLLGKFLSYSVYSPYDWVRLSEELEYTGHYIEIQNIRYSGMIHYEIICEMDITAVCVPKLIIQPIVENAIEHGFVSKSTGTITISVTEEAEEIDIIITDNGVGMDDEELHQINQKLQYSKSYQDSKSIGLLNVNQRVKNAYGQQYGLKIVSKKFINTSVILSIPIQKEESAC